MNNRQLLKHTAILVLLQILIFNNLQIWGFMVPYVYLLFFLWLPPKADVQEIIWAFLIGLLMDMFLDTQGIHAATCVFLSFMRPYFLIFFYGRSYLNKENVPIDTRQIYLYLSFLVFFHHFLIYNLEFFDLSKMLTILKYTALNGAYSLLLCFTVNVFFRRT